ncbi:MAG: phosphopantothenoylcysteine decarboxylase [Gemmataceae bacterium]
MNVLVTAGNTQTPIDDVRAITNIFTGRTGAALALEAYRQGHDVTLLTSHPERIGELTADRLDSRRWRAIPYRTFDELAAAMERHIAGATPDVVIHCAAVGDYRCVGVYAPAEGTRFEAGPNRWHGSQLVDRAAAKVKSDEAELWLRLERAPKLVDKIRSDWGFGGALVKFKLEAGVSAERLLEVAERSRCQSRADLMVANTLEDASQWAFVGPPYVRTPRAELPAALLKAIESLRA